MSKIKLYPLLVILSLLAQASLLLAEDIPTSIEGYEESSLSGTYTGFVETTYDDPNWVLVISDAILRANYCSLTGIGFEKVFEPCFWTGDNPKYNRYWKLEPGAKTGRAFPMSAFGTVGTAGTFDSLYIREGFEFQLYTNLEEPNDPNDLLPASPYLGGGRYVSLDYWFSVDPNGFEPGTLFVPGYIGDLEDYSIIVCRYPLRLHKTHNADPNGVEQEDYITYEISYENQPEGLSDPTDPNSGPQDTNNVIITDFLPLEMDFNSASDGGVYNSRLHTVTWNIGDLSIGDSGSVQLSVRVNRFAEPGSIITNYSEIKSGSLCAAAAVDVNVLYKPSICTLTKVDTNAPNPVLPGDSITYEITYGPNSQNHNNVRIVDYLAPAVTYQSLDDPNYNQDYHTYTWSIGSLSADDPEASVTLTVKVNQLAEPNGIIRNYCKIESDSSYTVATADTSVSPWQPDPPVIYVDNLAKRGSDTGMSWANAYLDLQDALERAASGYGSEIWVADGTYKPTTNPTDYDANFGLVDGVGLYGGFASTETARTQRNWLTNETILDGDIDNDSMGEIGYLVKATNVGTTTVIDGFTITMGFDASILADGASPTIRHNRCAHTTEGGHGYGIECISQSSPNITECQILDNKRIGIYCKNSDLNIINCIIKGNGEDGIYCDNSDLMAHNCIIEDNKSDGIYIDNYDSSSDGSITNNRISGNNDHGIYSYTKSEIEMKNNWIYANGADGSGDGIHIHDAYLVDAVIRNNTVADNNDYGIYSSYATAVTVSNCIIWGNGDGSLQKRYEQFDSIKYNCIEGGFDDTGNIDADPCFVAADANNYHLSPDSPCKDKGDPNYIPEPNETDIDGEPRVANGRVDMGADEFYWSPADFDHNEIVNFLDYAVLASAWLTDDPNISLDDDDDVDIYDLAIFCDDWLWQPAWKQSDPFKMMGSGCGRGSGFNEFLYTAAPLEQPEPQPEPEPQPYHTTQELIDWLEGILADGQITNEEGVRKVIESLKELL